MSGWSQRWNTLQICPRRESNSGGSDLWSNALPTRPWRHPAYKSTSRLLDRVAHKKRLLIHRETNKNSAMKRRLNKVERWSVVIYTDESKFDLFNGDGMRYHEPLTYQLVFQNLKFSGSQCHGVCSYEHEANWNPSQSAWWPSDESIKFWNWNWWAIDLAN